MEGFKERVGWGESGFVDQIAKLTGKAKEWRWWVYLGGFHDAVVSLQEKRRRECRKDCDELQEGWTTEKTLLGDIDEFPLHSI